MQERTPSPSVTASYVPTPCTRLPLQDDQLTTFGYICGIASSHQRREGPREAGHRRYGRAGTWETPAARRVSSLFQRIRAADRAMFSPAQKWLPMCAILMTMQWRAGRFVLSVLAFAAPLSVATLEPAIAQEAADVRGPAPGAATPLDNALWAFYTARYEQAATLTLGACAAERERLTACELHTSALLFQVRRRMGDDKDQQAAFKRCASCPALVESFDAAVARGLATARARLQEAPDEDETLFLLGKLDLNHVWLHVGTLGRRTGWKEYWEARRSLDAVLTNLPGHVRAKVARAWIDYIVDTKMRWGTRWLFGGGDKKRGLAAVRDASAAEADFFTRAEARFALWDMQVRERNVAAAVASAQALLRDFPENQELTRFVNAHDSRRSLSTSP